MTCGCFFPKNNHHGQAAPWKSAFSVFTNDKENMHTQKKKKKKKKKKRKKEISKPSLISYILSDL